MKPVRLMIAHNEPARVYAVFSLISGNGKGEFEIVSTVTTRDTAIKQLSSNPHVLLINPVVLKQHTLLRFLRSVHGKSPDTRVMLLLEGNMTDEDIIANIKIGVRGYIRLSDPPVVISKAILAVHEGEIWAERRILEKAISKPMLLPETLRSHIPGLSPLTNREMEMLTHVLQGATNREIAQKSSISERTVKTHLYRVYKKLNVKSRTKAIALLSH